MVYPTIEVGAMGRIATQIILDEEETQTLEHWQRSSTINSGLCFRAGIVLDCAAGYSGEELYRSGGDVFHNIDSQACPMHHAAVSPGGTKMHKSSRFWKQP